jgi:hypothetical protein
VKKVFGVAFGGMAILLVAFWVLRARRAQPDHPEGTASSSAASEAPVAPAPPPPPPSVAVDSDSAACAKMAALCSTSDEKVDTAECERKLADGRKLSGGANVQRSIACLAEAKTCAAATGCLAGGLGMGAVGEFLKGLGSSLSK